MKKSLFTMALVAAGAVIYLLTKNKEEEKSETPEIKLIDLKKDNDEPNSYNDSTEDPQEEKEETILKQEEQLEAEPESEEKEEDVLKEEIVSEPVNEPEVELHNESSPEETIAEENAEPAEEVQESVTEEEVQEEPVLESVEDEAVQEETEEPLPVEEETAEVTEIPVEEAETEEVETEEAEIEEQATAEQHEEEPVQKEEIPVPDYFEELNVAEENEESEDVEFTDKDLQGKILNEVEQEIKDNNDFSDFVRGNQQKDEEPRYSGTVYEVSDLYPYLSYEMIDKILDANIGFNHVYHDNQPIKIVHRVGFDKIEDLIEFVILIKEHDYRVEENNGLDMISISKELVVEDTIIISDIFNVSNQVYRLHGHYQGYEIIEQ